MTGSTPRIVVSAGDDTVGIGQAEIQQQQVRRRKPGQRLGPGGHMINGEPVPRQAVTERSDRRIVLNEQRASRPSRALSTGSTRSSESTAMQNSVGCCPSC